jgi:LytTr DNA-binding domain-containing protein
MIITQVSYKIVHKYKMVLLYVLGLLVIITLQTYHYVWYFKQPLDLSLFWSFVDWNLWFLMVASLFYIKVDNQNIVGSINKVSIILGVALLYPIIHILLSKSVYLLFFESKLSFMDDIQRQLSKRGFQNIFISVGLYFLFRFVWEYMGRPSHALQENEPRPVKDQLSFQDGKTTYHLKTQELKWIQSAKNYVVIELVSGQQIVVRKTIASVFTLLKDYDFIRISRSTIINKTAVYAIDKKSKYRHVVITKSGENFPIGKTYVKEVLSNMTF